MERINCRFLVKLCKSSVENVIIFCVANGLISDGFQCPKCGKSMKLYPHDNDSYDKYEWVCRVDSTPSHRTKRSIRSGSWFANSRMPISDILLLTHLFVMEMSHQTIMYELDLTKQAVSDWYAYFREVCLIECFNMHEPIGGVEKSVEITTSELKQREFHRGKHISGSWVYAGMERGTNKYFFKVVEKKDRATLLEVIKSFVLPGSTVFSDCWDDCLEDESFKRLSADNSLCLENSLQGVRSNFIVSSWSVIKRSLTDKCARDHFDSYIGEYFWRKNHSDTKDLTRAFLQAVKTVYVSLKSKHRSVEHDLSLIKAITMFELGCSNQVKILLAFQTYIELCEVYALRDVEYHYNSKLDMIFVSSKESSGKVNIYIPANVSDTVSMLAMEQWQDELVGDNENTELFLCLRDASSIGVYYKITKGLAAPLSLEAAQVKKSRQDTREFARIEICKSRHRLYKRVKESQDIPTPNPILES